MLLKPGKRKAIRWELLTSEVSSERFTPITEMRLQQLRGPASLTRPQRGQTGRHAAGVTSEEGRPAPGSRRSRTTRADHPHPRTGEPLTTWTRVDLSKNTGVGCHCLLQKIFLTQGSNLGLPQCRQTLYHLSHHIYTQCIYICIYTS